VKSVATVGVLPEDGAGVGENVAITSAESMVATVTSVTTVSIDDVDMEDDLLEEEDLVEQTVGDDALLLDLDPLLIPLLIPLLLPPLLPDLLLPPLLPDLLLLPISMLPQMLFASPSQAALRAAMSPLTLLPDLDPPVILDVLDLLTPDVLDLLVFIMAKPPGVSMLLLKSTEEPAPSMLLEVLVLEEEEPDFVAPSMLLEPPLLPDLLPLLPPLLPDLDPPLLPDLLPPMLLPMQLSIAPIDVALEAETLDADLFLVKPTERPMTRAVTARPATPILRYFLFT